MKSCKLFFFMTGFSCGVLLCTVILLTAHAVVQH